MTSNSHGLKVALLVIGDLIILGLTLFITLLLRYDIHQDRILLIQHIIPFSIIFGTWLVFLGAFELYNVRFLKNSKRFLYRLSKAMVFNTIAAIIIFYLIPLFEIEPRRNLLAIAFLGTGFLFLWRLLFNLLAGKSPAAKVLFFGITKEVIELADYLLKNPQLGYKPLAFMSVNGEEISYSLPLPHFAPHQDLRPIIQELGADSIVISRDIKENKTLVTALFQVIPIGVAVMEFPGFYAVNTGKIPLSLIGEVWFLENLAGAKKNFYEFFKRVLDLVLALLVLVPTAVLFPIIAVAVKFDSEGPVFFRQNRVGKNGKDFELVKFRSMIKNAESIDGSKQNGHDLRQTRVDAFLRKHYLDDLPQIINVIRGEMSFIGPRPERPQYVKELKEKIPFYEMRLLVLPGL